VCWKQHFSGLVNVMSSVVLKGISRIFTKLTPMMYYGTEMIALNFGVRNSHFKVTVE